MRHPVKIFFAGWLAFVLFTPAPGSSQVTDSQSIFSRPVILDTFVIEHNFDVNSFISRVRKDTTFYKAFKTMRLVPYTAENQFVVSGPSGDTLAGMTCETIQKIDRGCRTTVNSAVLATGNFYTGRGDYNYYTASLFAHLFFADQPVCNETDIVAGALDVKGQGRMGNSEYQLKQLIFNPGAKVSGVPFMGSRESIFDPGEADKYDFKISRAEYDSADCYVFRITPRKGFESKVLYNELTTWFRVSDYSIVARNYSLSYHTLVYDFDVSMKVRTRSIGGRLYPTFIAYDGNWHVFTQKRERVKFSVSVRY